MAGSGSRGRSNDNHGEASARLYGVGGPDVQASDVRRTLAEQAARVRPSGADFAAVAVARVRRVRRRRRVLGVAGSLGAVVTVLGMLMSYGAPGGLSDAPAYTTLFGDPLPVTVQPTLAAEDGFPEAVSLAADFAVDLVIAERDDEAAVVSPDGAVIGLGPVAEVLAAYRVDSGWAVVNGGDGDRDLWWVTSDSPPMALLSDMDAIALGPGRVAWQQGATLSAAVLTGGELTGQATTTVPAGEMEPVGFLGDAVLLSRDDGAWWDVWPPAAGDYRPDWSAEVAQVFGTAPDGEVALGLAVPRPGEAGPCLARLRVASGLNVTARACPDGLPEVAGGSLSPGGRWLVAAAPPPPDRYGPASASSTVVVDVSAVFGEQTASAWDRRMDPVAVIPLTGTPAGRGQPVWPTADEAVLATHDSLVWLAPRRVLSGQPEAIDELSLGAIAPLLVPAADS